MTDTENMGGNSREVLVRYGERLTALLDDIGDLQADVKQIYDEAKSAGFNVKVLRRIVKELRADDDKRAGQLAFELEVDTYRAAFDLPRNYGDAAEAAKEAAAEIPEPRQRRGRAAAAGDA